MKKLIILFGSILLCFQLSFAENDSTKTKWKIDTNYVTNYPNDFIISLYQSYRFYDLIFTQTFVPDSLGASSFNYIARGNNSSGIGFAWDKIAFALSSSVEVTEKEKLQKGITKATNLSFTINSKKYRLEAAYRKYTGFYDNYTPRHDSTFTTDSIYHQLSRMNSKAFKLKGFYFFNKKGRFSYGAAFNNSARQLKSAGTFLLATNVYGFSINSDTSILPPNTNLYYPQWEKWNSFKNLGISFNVGYTLNLVILKHLFGNLTGSMGWELQNRKYATSDGSNSVNDWKFGYATGDLRGSIGFNSRRFFFMLTYIGDFSIYNLGKITINSRLHSGAFTIGYRFKMKENKVTSWLRNNKIYKLL